ncbi:MAG: peroxiredoxin [Bacteroidota bacterium]
MQAGDMFPDFSLLDETGDTIRMKDLIGAPLVIYFYPKDDTPGCTKEACYFRDQFEFFTDEGAKVIGISKDSPASHKKFKEKHNLPFTLLTDEGNQLRKLVGVPTNLLGLIPGRVTYIMDTKGKVVHVFNSQLDWRGHVDQAIDTLRGMKAGSDH